MQTWKNDIVYPPEVLHQYIPIEAHGDGFCNGFLREFGDPQPSIEEIESLKEKIVVRNRRRKKQNILFNNQQFDKSIKKPRKLLKKTSTKAYLSKEIANLENENNILQTENGLLSIKMSKDQDAFAKFKIESKVREKSLSDKLKYREENAKKANECNLKSLKLNEIPAFLNIIEKASRKISSNNIDDKSLATKVYRIIYNSKLFNGH